MKLAIWSYESPAHVGVSRAAASFSGLHCVVRAPKGDGYATIMLSMFERLGVVPPLSFSALTEGTLAGESADLPVLLREIDARSHPEMIVITRSATASVLQEHLDGEVRMMKPGEIGAEIFFASTHPVRDTETSAFALTTREIIEHFAQDVPRTERPSVNIIGPSLLGFHDRSNVESLRRIFETLGVQVNAVIPLGASPDDLRKAGSAWLNVGTAYELAQPSLDFLQQRFGTPYARELPYGEAGTTRFLREVCGYLEIPRDRINEAARSSNLLWYSRTVDAHALSGKRVAVFGAPSAAAGIARALHDELDLRVDFIGTYVMSAGDWLRERVAGITDDVIVTSDYRDVAARIDAARPDIMFGSQMERHSASGFGVPCAVISPPCHILNFPLSYAPLMGYDGANYLGDIVNRTQVLGLEHHLIETFGPRNQGRFADAAPEPAPEGHASAPNGAGGELRWSPEAERLLGKVPFFVRKKARSNVEKYARERDLRLIDEATLLRAREHVSG